MSLSGKYTSRVVVATGHVSKEFACGGLYRFVMGLRKDKFWDALPVTELERANAIFERILYTLPPEPERRPAKPLQRGYEVFHERQAPERDAPEQVQVRRQERRPQEATVRPAPPQQEVSQRSPDQGRQQAPVAQRQENKGKNGSRSERDSHVTKINSSMPKESGASRGTSERPSIAARLEAHRAQVRRPSAPAREKAKSVAKNRPKTR